jgi:hypothetical protein
MWYTFGAGGAGRLAYERFAKWVPDEGFAIKDGWVSASNDGCFLRSPNALCPARPEFEILPGRRPARLPLKIDLAELGP